jgi:hypothetical protein
VPESYPIPVRSGVGAISSEALILIAGILTSIATVAINAIAARGGDGDLLSLSVWFIVPVGAIIGGMAAASGYYFAAVRTHTMPSRTFLLEMIGIAISTWVLALWVSYASAQSSDGTWVRSQLSFWDFFKFQAEHTQLSIYTRAGVSETGELGGLGYAREFVQLLGFMLGGLFVWVTLSEREVCATCRKYAREENLLTKQPPIRLQKAIDESNLSFPNLVRDAELAIGKSPLVGMDLKLLQCPKCFAEWARPAVGVQSGRQVVSRKLKRYLLKPEQAIALRKACRDSTRR